MLQQDDVLSLKSFIMQNAPNNLNLAVLKATYLTCPLNECTDEMLIQRTLDGDDGAFGVLFERHHTQFVRLARGYVKREADAYDVVQTAFLNMYRKLDTFQIGSHFRAWAYRVVVNSALMQLRKKRRRQEVDFECVEPTSLNTSYAGRAPMTIAPDVNVEQVQLRILLNDAIETLPNKYKIVFVMRESEDLSLQEISDRLDLSVPAVKSRLHRARLFLRAGLERHMDDYGFTGFEVEAA